MQPAPAAGKPDAELPHKAALARRPSGPPQASPSLCREVPSSDDPQTNEMEVTILSSEEQRECYLNYKRVFGSFPEPKRELTQEQLTALDALLKTKSTPFADFSIWAPYGHRVLRKIKLTGMTKWKATARSHPWTSKLRTMGGVL